MRAVLVASIALLVPAAATAGSTATTLTIVYQAAPGATKTTWTLRCSPVGGTHPRRAAACRRLAQLDNPFRPLPSDAICTQIYGGPDVALVRGTFRGRRVWTYFRLRDGCEISRWKRVVPLLPARDA